MSERKRLINDLRVIDLRAELEKRNLDKSGVRGVLIQRLSKYLEEEEGQDPATYSFDLGADVKSTPTKRGRRTESANAVEAEPEPEETPQMEDMIVQDDAGEEEDTVEPADSSTEVVETGNGEAEVEASDQADTSDQCLETHDNDDSEATQAKKPRLEEEQDQNQDQDHKQENNTDADDSINLDLGEDELLNEEAADCASKPKTDEASEEAADAGREHTGDDAADGATDGTNAATSNDWDEADKDKGEKKEGDGDKKEKKDDSKEGGARNLWVSGLSGDTRAKDLKQLCSKHGKVIGAKVVTNARTPGSRCYGYVTMASGADAENCIKHLHRTELHGRMISVEKARSESESAARRQPSRPDRRVSKDRADKDQDGTEGAAGDKTQKKDGDAAADPRSGSRTREKSHRSEKDRVKRSTRSRERRRSPRDVLSLNKILRERDVGRARERAREEERRRRALEESLREQERRQRQEKHRLALERDKLRAEREKIEREKAVLLRLERERHRLEREKLELERLELKRAQLRLEEERRKRSYDGSYRKPAAAASPPPEPAYERDRHKRAPAPPLSSSRGQFEAPPPPRFEATAAYDRGGDKRDRDYKRDYPRHVSSSANMKYPSNGSSTDDARQPMPPGTRPKETGSRYDSRPYRPSPPNKSDPRNWSASSRYADTAPPKGGGGGTADGEMWPATDSRYSGAAYEQRYQPSYQPPPPGAPYPDRYAANARSDYRKY